MPLGIITKNTPEIRLLTQCLTKNTPQWLTFDLSKGCTDLKLSTLDQPGVPDTHTEKSASGLIAFRNYWRKDSFPPFLRLNFTDCVFGSFFWPGGKKPKVLCPKLKIRSCQTLYSLRLFGQTPGLMPLGIITKNTPERLTFDLSKGCTGLKLGTLD